MPRTKQLDRDGPSRFTKENLEAIAKDLKSGRLPLMRTQISDDHVTGLRALINKSGLISFHASYQVGSKRPFCVIGDLNEDSHYHISIDEARQITKTIKALGDRGVDVQDGLHKRLVFELLRDGEKWRLPPMPKRGKK